MRWRSWLWLCVSVLCFFAAAYFWRLGDQWAAEKAATPAAQTTNQDKPAARPIRPTTQSQLAPVRLLSDPGSLNVPPAVAASRTNNGGTELSYRLSNNHTKTPEQLARSEHSVLLENALIDTDRREGLPIPGSLKAQGDPGTYIVQSRGPTDSKFRSAIKAAGASIVAYIPNNAYMVRGSGAAARQLMSNPETQAVLPYEPYYKLKPSLLKLVMEQTALPKGEYLNLLLFEDAREAVLTDLQKSGVQVVGQDRSPFGPVVKVQPGMNGLAGLAAMTGVQAIEMVHTRRLANDLSRAALRISSDSVTPTNYFNLTGTNIIVAVNDTGVDTNHPDLQGRVWFDSPISGVDSNGHGTHVAGIIGGSGSKSLTVSNAQGSVMPPSPEQFRGKAPGAKLFSMEFSASDRYLQETAARTNAIISNNSWTYDTVEYDLAAASFDAAVRDSLPTATGPQAIAYVFPTGNSGSANVEGTGANESGSGGVPDSIRSPGTAKNVITVGAVEQLRSITNEVSICIPDATATNGISCQTNLPWFGGTDSSNQVASFSGRGNVGIMLEGDFGRFKPDVVAPGSFVVSARSGQWDEQDYYSSLDYSYDLFTQQIDPDWGFVTAVFVPANAIRLTVRLLSDVTTPLPVYIISPTGAVSPGTNQVSVPPTGVLDPKEDFWQVAVSNNTPDTVNVIVQTVLTITNDNGNYFQVLSNMNAELGPHYRYESGSSMAAAEVSGTLALMHEFFQQHLKATNSPALMKALLINGARSLGNAYNFQVRSTINYQGWGQVQLPNSIPAAITNLAGSPTAPSPMYYFDQNPTNALVTGQSYTRFFSISPTAFGQDLRVTVAWTDPPGNPLAGIKLVNDLDLVVTNLDTGDVYFGNDITGGNDYNLAWETNNSPRIDIVNNVENVYLHAPTLTNFSVTVIGHRVNVNAVSGHPDDVAQDYALVVSSGNGSVPDALQIQTRVQDAFVILPNVTFVTNSFPNDPENPVSGGLLLHQHVGANSPLLSTNPLPLLTTAGGVTTTGMTNQWRFYMLSNEFNFTNASFVTFMPPNLAIPRMGVNTFSVENASRPEADIDMYVSTESGLTNLDPLVLLRADKSLGRGGTEIIVYSNAAPGAVYYVGIKSEDQMTAEFGFLGSFSLFPPGESDAEGNRYLRGMPVPAFIPPGIPREPQAATVLGINIAPITVRRVIVTNTWNHTMPGSLIGNLSHNKVFAVLNNHTCKTDPTGNCYTNIQDYIYEDNGEGNVLFSRPSDGPGSLKDFIGEEGVGLWQLTMVNSFPAGTGAVNRLGIKLEKQNLDDTGVIATILPNTFYFDSIEVPADATNLTVCVSGNTAPLELYVQRGALPSTVNYDYHKTINPPGDCLEITILDTPPLVAGRYYIGVFNPSDVAQRVRVRAILYRNPYAVPSSISETAGAVTIADDAVTYAYITNLFHLTVSALDVGLLIHHPRISDLAITLVSPSGTRVLLFEDRGGVTTNGLGTFGSVTNGPGFASFGTTNMTPFYTNDFDDVPTGYYAPGAVFDGWRVLTNYALIYPLLPAPWLSNNVLVLSDSVVSNTLPTTNSTSYSLSFKVTHAPFITGTIAWWPLDEDGRDIWGGFDGLLSGDVVFNANTGMVNQAFFGDGVGTRMMVPRCPDLNVGQRRGFTIEGWVRPVDFPTNSALAGGSVVMADGFENATNRTTVIPARSYVSGWLVESGDVDLLSDGSGFFGSPFEGLHALDLNGNVSGSISRQFSTTPGTDYFLSFAFCRNPSPALGTDFVASADLTIGPKVTTINYSGRNSDNSLAWSTTSIVFTATSPLTTIRLSSRNSGDGGMYLDAFVVRKASPVLTGAPILEWSEATSVSNEFQGVQFWLGALPGTNNPGALMANFYDTNSQPHIVSTAGNAITNGGWQHVALSYDAVGRVARFYTNGQLASAQSVSRTNFMPRTSGDVYLGYHPGTPMEAAAFSGGLDEFGVYSRALWDNEVLALYTAGKGGKYGDNATRAPVTNSVQLITSLGTTTYIFTNGFSWWTNGTQWETNIIFFQNLLGAAYTNGPATNFTGIILSNPDENAAFDEFVLSSIQTNYVDGLMHFTESTNLARLPIKFATTPYIISNFPPVLVFSNEFELATQAVYQVGSVIPGITNSAAVGVRNWTVVAGPVTVISNTAMDALGSNALALGSGAIQCTLPTSPGHRYELTYSVRGPGAVSWWGGDVEPLSQRAWDLLGGNNGAFLHDATNSGAGLVNALGRRNALFLPGITNPTNGYASKIELGDPANLRLTNGFTIEGWVRPLTSTNAGVEQILFRGDSRNCSDPYYLALRRVSPDTLDIIFHIQDEGAGDCGIALATVHQPVIADRWQHIAAVFEPNVALTNNFGWATNQLRIYYNGVWLKPADHDVELLDSRSATQWNDLTGRFPFADLDARFSPGVSIGNRSRLDNSEPFKGYIDELTVYGRALTEPEIAAIAAAGGVGKADFRAPPTLSLAKVTVLLDNVPLDTGNGDNARWTTRSSLFTADHTNLVLTLRSLLPGTIVDGISLSELPAEMDYLPEQSLAILNGEDAFGVWGLEIWDTRVGGYITNDLPSLLQWELNFVLPPSNPPPVITLVHGIPYTNSLTAFGIQNFVVNVPQWATNATNVLLFASDRTLTNPQNVGVFFDLTNHSPISVSNALFWPPLSAGTTNLTTNSASMPFIVPGDSYYLTITNPNPFAVTFAYGVWFDILSLQNCQPQTNFVWQAGIPRYFQLDVPTNALPPGEAVAQAFVYLTGVESNYTGLRSNLTVVVSQHLPLPDLTHFDYISHQASTNDDIIMVLTNTTPFPIQNTRWYVGVFSRASTNIPFVVQSCYTTRSYPVIVNLTNGVPFTVADFTNRFIAPPGPPRSFFFEFEVTNYVGALLFELYDLSGDADLVLEREIPPTMAPYFDGSFRVGREPEQIVVRTSLDVPDLRGKWYLGIFNNQATNLAYTIRAVTQSGGLLQSLQPFVVTGPSPMAPPHQSLMQWNSVMGELYKIDYTLTLSPPIWTPLFNGVIQATTPLTTFEVPTFTNGMAFFRVTQISAFNIPPAPMTIQLWTNDLVRISWSTSFPGQRLQYSDTPWGPWVFANLPVVIEGNEYVVYDRIGTAPKYYRLIP